MAKPKGNAGKSKSKRIYAGGQKKVSKKRKATQTYKWIKLMFGYLDVINERLDLIERFLGGTESMKRVKENNDERENNGLET